MEDDVGGHSISVVIPTYNRSHLLPRALNSVLRQTYQPAEIVLVDDCSSDNTQEVAASCFGEIPLLYMRLEKNCGGAAARNAGIGRARGEYIAFLDSDDEWQPNHLSVMMRTGVRYSGDFVVAGSALNLRRHQDWDLIFRMIERGVTMIQLSDLTTKYYVPIVGATANVATSSSTVPSLRFLAKHKAKMRAKTRARFVALEIMRRRDVGLGIVKYLLQAALLGGISVKEFAYYVREALVAKRVGVHRMGKHSTL
jgi:glycosyltransferase involved in cell wall biosynthesis